MRESRPASAAGKAGSSRFQKHLYVILHPNEALVASQLEPPEFGKHYAVGSPRHFTGKVIFAEIDLGFRNPYFDIDALLADCENREDPSRPKRTKFISTYRVIEHVDLAAMRDLYLVTVDGKTVGIPPQREYHKVHQPNLVRIYQEVAPIELLVASNLAPRDFGRYITGEFRRKGSPKLFFTQVTLDIQQLLQAELLHSPLPNVHLGHLKEAVRELQANPEKRTKTISLESILGMLSYRDLRSGFWLAAGDEVVFYPLPSEDELRGKYFDWMLSA